VKPGTKMVLCGHGKNNYIPKHVTKSIKKEKLPLLFLIILTTRRKYSANNKNALLLNTVKTIKYWRLCA